MNKTELQACAAAGCSKDRYQGKLFCRSHQRSFALYGDPLNRIRNIKPIRGLTNRGYINIQENHVQKFVHVRIAEKAIGRELKGGECVHHVDGNPSNNENKNLVVCPSHKYHFLLHRRQRAFDSCGDANKRKCSICGTWDDPKNMYIYGANDIKSYHQECKNRRSRETYDPVKKKAMYERNKVSRKNNPKVEAI